MRFPAERALFAVDFIPVKAVAFRNLPDAYIPDWMESLKRVEWMDFDILVPGHGPIGGKADVRAFRGYMEDLYAAVLEQTRVGKSLEEMQQTIRLGNKFIDEIDESAKKLRPNSRVIFAVNFQRTEIFSLGAVGADEIKDVVVGSEPPQEEPFRFRPTLTRQVQLLNNGDKKWDLADS